MKYGATFYPAMLAQAPDKSGFYSAHGSVGLRSIVRRKLLRVSNLFKFDWMIQAIEGHRTGEAGHP